MLDELPPQEYNNFYKSLQFVLNQEGGYVNDPRDPGGETKWGISKRAHPDVDIPNLTAAQAADIYYEDYWVKTMCPALDYPFCTVVFDTAVNCGPDRANSWVQKSGGSAQEYLNLRKDYYVNLVTVKPTMMPFLKGWINRIIALRKLIDQPPQP